MKSDKILILYSFFVSLLLTVLGVLSAKNPSQMINGLIFLPLVFYFGTNILHFPLNGPKTVPARRLRPEPPKPVVSAPLIVPAGVADSNKRLFLKLIGSSGVMILLMALFTKKAQASFFGSAPTAGAVYVKDIAGTKINPAEKSPTDGYAITNIDDSGTTHYYGFVKKTGDWYIMSQATNGVYLYAKGTTDFSGNWSNRGSLSYDYFNVVFG